MVKGLRPPIRIDGLMARVRNVIEAARTVSGTFDGGFFCLADQKGSPIICSPVGNVKDEDYVFAQEQARRLAKNPNHCSSWQSRDDDAEKYGGAVRGNAYIYSFSGFAKKINEAAMLALADMLSDFSGDMTAADIAAISKNEFLQPLLELARQRTSYLIFR